MLLALRTLLQARQMETTSISGAIDELEARQIDFSLISLRAFSILLMILADQYPVFLDLHHENSDSEGVTESWTVDLEVGLTATLSMAANARVMSRRAGIKTVATRFKLLPTSASQSGAAGAMLSQTGLVLAGLAIYPVPRDSGSDPWSTAGGSFYRCLDAKTLGWSWRTMCCSQRGRRH